MWATICLVSSKVYLDSLTEMSKLSLKLKLSKESVIFEITKINYCIKVNIDIPTPPYTQTKGLSDMAK